MAEELNIDELEKEKKLSIFDKKMKGLLDEIDEHLDQIGGDFGPILMAELQNRLENIVKMFNEEVNTLFQESFEKWNVTNSQVREFAKNDIKLPKKRDNKKNNNINIPGFIKNVKFGPIRPK